MATKKFFGSKSRRLRDAQEFLDKIKIKEETDLILSKCLQKKKEIEKQKNEIALLFIKSNEKEGALKHHITSINSKIYDTSVEIDSNIERLSKEILVMIGEIQIKIKKALEYTKLEIEKEIEEKFNEAEKRQQEKMNEKIREQNEMIAKVNSSRYKLDLLKIQFEETNNQCEKLNKYNERLKINLDTVKSDNENLNKKLNEVKEENKKIQKEYDSLFAITKKNEFSEEKERSFDPQTGQEEKERNDNDEFLQKSSSLQQKEEVKDQYDKDYNPKNLIKLLKDIIKASHRDNFALFQKCSDEKKQKNEASQLLQKCIDDINIEIHNINQTLPKLSIYDKLFDNKNSTNTKNSFQIDKKKIYEKKLEILTYIFDNALQNVKYKRMFIGNPNVSQRSTFYK